MKMYALHSCVVLEDVVLRGGELLKAGETNPRIRIDTLGVQAS